VVLGPGDDAALLRPAAGCRLVISSDMLLSGVHFPVDTGPEDIAYKSLMVNLSDLAAMGATPRWYTVSLALPKVSKIWIDGFCAGLLKASLSSGIALVGGDITHGTLAIAVTIMGECPEGMAMLRRNARVDDDIYVTESLGDAALGLQILQGKLLAEEADRNYCVQRLRRPQARNEAGLAIRSLARAAIDISDGLLQDLGHIARASGLQAVVRAESLPLSDSYLRLLPAAASLTPAALQPAISFGDDYELCFTAAIADRDRLATLFADMSLRCTRIGSMHTGQGVKILDHEKNVIPFERTGYQHFLQ